MSFAPGFRFEHLTPTNRGSARNFINERGASVAVQDIGFYTGQLQVVATNVVNRGSLSATADGLIHIEGSNVDLSRSTIFGSPPNPFAGGSFISTNFFLPDRGIGDYYWGGDTNLIVLNQLLSIIGGVVQISGPRHTVTNAPVPPFSTTRFIPSLYQPTPYIFTNRVNATNSIIQAVFLKNRDTNVNVNVRFIRNYPETELRTVVAQLSIAATNIISGSPETRQLFIVDELASRTNFLTLSNASSRVSYRPASFDITRVYPFTDDSNGRANSTLREDLFTHFYSTTFPRGYRYTNANAQGQFASYGAYVTDGGTSSLGLGGDGLGIPGSGISNLTATNSGGRVEITAKNLNLERTKIRGESSVTISAENLISTEGAVVEAPQLYYLVGASDQNLTVKNLARKEVSRLFGDVTMFSQIWTNYIEITTSNTTGVAASNGSVRPLACPPGHLPLLSELLPELCDDSIPDPDPNPNPNPDPGTGGTTTRYEITYHMLLIDVDLRSRQPVSVNGLFTKGRETTINDQLLITDLLNCDAENLTLNERLTFNGNLRRWANTNFPNIKTLTNNGILLLPDTIDLGVERQRALDVIKVNGTNFAFAHFYNTKSFINNGTIGAGIGVDNGQGITFFRQPGQIQITSSNAALNTGSLEAGGDISIDADEIKIRDHSIATSGILFLRAKNTLADAGAGSGNRFTVRAGFQLSRKGALGDLLGTTIESSLGTDEDALHVWAGEDRGVSALGFKNNAAVGKLSLSGQVGSLFRFEGPIATNKYALYVDFLDLATVVAQDLENSIRMSDNFKIYFANSSVPVQELDGRLGGKLQWVRQFSSPSTSVPVLLSSGETILVNKALRDSLTIDSDGDGIANGYDNSPFGGALINDISILNRPPVTAVISFQAAAKTTYRIEKVGVASSAGWTLVRTIRNESEQTATMSVDDAINPAEKTQFYRVTYNPSENLGQ